MISSTREACDSLSKVTHSHRWRKQGIIVEVSYSNVNSKWIYQDWIFIVVKENEDGDIIGHSCVPSWLDPNSHIPCLLLWLWWWTYFSPDWSSPTSSQFSENSTSITQLENQCHRQSTFREFYGCHSIRPYSRTSLIFFIVFIITYSVSTFS